MARLSKQTTKNPRDSKDYRVWKRRFDYLCDSQEHAGARIIQLEVLLKENGIQVPEKWPLRVCRCSRLRKFPR